MQQQGKNRNRRAICSSDFSAWSGHGLGKRLLLRVAALCHGSSKLPPPPAPLGMAEMPRVEMAGDGRVEHLEKFSHYVARQIGFEDASECPHLCKAANNYLRQTNNCMADVYGLLDGVPEADALYVKLVDELERCILGYFAFHWDHSTTLVTQALTVDSANKKKLRNVILEANSRKQRFERITKDLKVTRVFSTLVHEMKAIGTVTGMNGEEEAHCTDVMAPVAHSDRSPVLLLMGGGMGAGKSTVLKEILQEPFWIEAGKNALVVEADAFKETDVIYRAISSMGHHNDMLQTAELLPDRPTDTFSNCMKDCKGTPYSIIDATNPNCKYQVLNLGACANTLGVTQQVHKSSTDAASSLLVTALNEGRDVILDGTLSWEPFVEQTIAMARAVHSQRHRMGVGYKVDEDGTITENYWEPVPNDQDFVAANRDRKPYRIEVVGVVCDAYLAVARGIRRAIMTGRAVRVNSQLTSHKRFAAAFQKYCQLVDGAKLYSSNSLGSPQLIAWKGDINGSLLVEPREIDCLDKVSNLNEGATSLHDLYPGGATTCGSRSIWDDMIVAPSRATVQREIREAIRSVEPTATPTAL
ncbi:hypothetical protein TRIUR3_32141 [Triticum urartu]|uniref:Zeta toxin domain-containing protein n=1 Tax=Triticum urartu TaxID=4572 RepID=M8AA98_TRIUA|nr:hypothetical protein TRIUR3_32141 [Triticum urartu]